MITLRGYLRFDYIDEDDVASCSEQLGVGQGCNQ